MNMKKEVMHLLFCMNSSLVIILFHDNPQSHVAKMTLQKLTHLGYETLPHPSYSPDLSPIDYHFLKHLDTFLGQKTFCSKEEVETAFKDFLASKLLEIYCTGINNLINRWQKYIDVQGSNFD